MNLMKSFKDIKKPLFVYLSILGAFSLLFSGSYMVWNYLSYLNVYNASHEQEVKDRKRKTEALLQDLKNLLHLTGRRIIAVQGDLEKIQTILNSSQHLSSSPSWPHIQQFSYCKLSKDPKLITRFGYFPLTSTFSSPDIPSGIKMLNILAYKQKLLDLLGVLTDATVLDYGCGRGDFIELILKLDKKPKCIYAVDSNKETIIAIENRFQQEIRNGSVITKVCTSPRDLKGIKFDKIICHNVLECVDDKVAFINHFSEILAKDGTFILSHHDFDSAIYNSSDKYLTRTLIHNFADTQQKWMDHADGLIGRKIPGLIMASGFRDFASIETWRLVEREFKPGMYGYLMATMIQEAAKHTYSADVLELWIQDLEKKDHSHDYYFAIDLVVAIINPK